MWKRRIYNQLSKGEICVAYFIPLKKVRVWKIIKRQKFDFSQKAWSYIEQLFRDYFRERIIIHIHRHLGNLKKTYLSDYRLLNHSIEKFRYSVNVWRCRWLIQTLFHMVNLWLIWMTEQVWKRVLKNLTYHTHTSCYYCLGLTLC